MKRYTADFETVTWLEDETYVWAWAVCNIENSDEMQYGNSIESFIEYCKELENAELYFHNLKFDGSFILYYLLTNGYEYAKDKKDIKDNTFTTVISDLGQFYSITVYFKCYKSKKVKVTFIDSLKIINMKVSKIAKTFGLPISKLELDYNKTRERGHILTKEEKEYITNDVKIMAMALKILFDEGLTKHTAASNALSNYKHIISDERFLHFFPVLEKQVDEEIRKAYKGGFTYLNPIYKEKTVGKGVVLDVNSLYPSVMYEKDLPYGEPVYFEGKYKEDKIYPLYIQTITCSFELKKNKIPTIQMKSGTYNFKGNEYLTSSYDPVEDEMKLITMTMTNIDLKLFLENYDVKELVFDGGWKFKSIQGLFKDYIDKWIDVKIRASKEGNLGLRAVAKLQLNSLYGKFAKMLEMRSKKPIINDEKLKFQNEEKEEKDGIYIPVATFITAYAREKTIRTSQSIKEYSINKYGKDFYCYSDTDSIHTLLPIEELKKFCQIDDTKLGFWKNEGEFTKAKFIRQKCYLEEFWKDRKFKGKIKKTKISRNREIKGFKDFHITKITCAGLPESCYKYVDWKNFKEGFTCGGKLTYKQVKGGVKLVETDFTINP